MMTLSMRFIIIYHILGVALMARTVHGQVDDTSSSVVIPLPTEALPPISNAPITIAPTTSAPITLAPVTSKPSQSPANAPVTVKPTTSAPSTLAPVTFKPSKSPTLEPTPGPTSNPTLSPTELPSVSKAPTFMPSHVPTISLSPTTPPSLAPSTTRTPSMMPSDSMSPTNAERYPGLKMTLVGIRSIEDVSDWEAVTASYYESVYNNAPGDADDDGGSVMVDAVVEITLTNINTKASSNRRRKRRLLLGKRNLQQQQSSSSDNVSVVVTYTQSTTYRSRDPNVGMNEILKLPLSTESYREGYMLELKSSLEDGYDDLTSVSSISTPWDVEGDKAIGGGGSADTGKLSLGYIIGIACCSAAVLILLGGLIYYRNSVKNDVLDAASANADNPATNDNGDIVLDLNPGGGSSNMVNSKDQSHTLNASKGPPLGDMSVASGDYYPEGGGGAYGEQHCPDGASEELLTIYAPPGKLGVVIDAPDNGAPLIHNLKQTSPIADKLRVGDRLVAVDNEDVRLMTAIKVSKLISGKSSKSRKLTVIRYVVPT